MKSILNPKNGYLDYDAVFEDGVDVYVILGQRADGKTYGILQRAVNDFLGGDYPSAYVRRFDETLRKSNLQDLVKPHHATIKKTSRGKYNATEYKSKRFYMANIDDDLHKTTSATPFLYCYSLNTWENSKGPDSGIFKYIIFDEIVSFNKYLPNEYTAFENVLSSVLRNRGESTLIMLGNPVNQICPYFDEFDIDPHKLKPGDIIYRVSKNGYKLKFIYVPPMDAKRRKSDKFFQFRKNDSSISTGYWEFGEFPHVPGGLIKSATKFFEFAILFKNQTAVCEFYTYNNVVFCFWRPGNTDKILESGILLFSDVHFFANHVRTAWTRDPVTLAYDDCVRNNRQYFANNRTGNLVEQWYTIFVRTAGRFGK